MVIIRISLGNILIQIEAAIECRSHLKKMLFHCLKHMLNAFVLELNRDWSSF